MALKIRLRPQGRKNRAFYRLVVAEETSRRNGKYVEALGWYNPFETKEENILSLKDDRIDFWLQQGAQLSEKAEKLFKQSSPELFKQQREREQAQKIRRCKKRRECRKKETAGAK